MRDNSGQGKSSNNLKDPTLKEHRPPQETPGDKAVIGRNARERGETSIVDRFPADTD